MRRRTKEEQRISATIEGWKDLWQRTCSLAYSWVLRSATPCLSVLPPLAGVTIVARPLPSPAHVYRRPTPTRGDLRSRHCTPLSPNPKLPHPRPQSQDPPQIFAAGDPPAFPESPLLVTPSFHIRSSSPKTTHPPYFAAQPPYFAAQPPYFSNLRR
ncbi:hypothetical protein L484_010539 [Morus notabilis]|uniref:Uncharacterized protein n=1 Tax=Morus notabilis TaxID=981085 RepID=W9RHE1_9ROSA|nr:hypothetical protein L484_010539 [Morus notabilis]